MTHNVVSVIVPVYNIENEIERCIASITEQTYKDLEIILVDDGSTDGSLEICQKYADIDRRIIVVHKENGGLVSARKAGMQLASGEYVAHIDGDDWVEKDYIQSMINATDCGTVDVVIAGFVMESVNGEAEKATNEIPNGVYTEESIKHFIYPVMLERIFPSNCSKLFKKSLAYERQMSVNDCVECDEDTVTVYPILLNAKKISIIDVCEYHYVRRMNSLSTFGTEASVYFATMRNVYDILKKEFVLHEEKEILMLQLERLISSRLTAGLSRYYSLFIQKYLFPYELVSQGSSVVLYGAGTVGRDFYRQITKNHYCDIVLWVDSNYEMIDIPYGHVKNPDTILREQYDYIVVGVSRRNIALDIIGQLKDMGVLAKKIIWQEDWMMDLNIRFD